MLIDSAFWRGKRVFITGHTGFKGSWLSLWLQKLGAEVYGYSKAPPTEPNLYSVADVAVGMAGETIGDIRDIEQLIAALRRARPDIVVHMAAETIVLRCLDDPIETFSTNVLGTATLLQAVRSADSVRAVIAVTSDKCYENREWYWGYRETDSLGGSDPYSASKAAAELVITAMRQSYFNRSGIGIASVRAGNVIGGGDWAQHRLIPDLMRALMAGRPCVIRNPDFVRPWQHVLEPLSGYLKLAEALWRDAQRFGGAWNFGPLEENAKPVAWIADRLGSLWQSARPWVLADDPIGHETSYLKLDISKSRKLLGWRPVWSLDVTLQRIVDWFEAYQDGARMQDCVAMQIEQFRVDSIRSFVVRHDPIQPESTVPKMFEEADESV
jgi:CDP-glucose 4,6-dehydratase